MRVLLARGAIVYGGIRACSRAVPYFLLPYLTLYLDPGEFGKLALFQASLGLVALFVTLSTPSALNRYFFDLPADEIAAWTFNSIAIIALNTVLVAFVIYQFRYRLLDWLGIDVAILMAVPLVALGYCILNLILDRWRHQMMFFRYAALSLAQLSIDVWLTLFLVIALGLGVFGRISGLGVSYLAVGIVGMILLYAGGQLRFQTAQAALSTMILFSVPLIPYTLGAWVIASVDRYILNSVLGPAETGIYSIGFLFGSVIVLFQDLLAQAWGPVVFRALSSGERRDEIVRLYYSIVGVIVLLGMAISVLAPLLSGWFVEESFARSADVVPWITWAFVLNAMRAFLVHFIQFEKKNHLLMLTTVIPAVAHIGITYWLISIDGIVGAAKALLISMTLALVLTVLVVRKLSNLPWLQAAQRS